MKKTKMLTNKEMMALPMGTWVRINKDHAQPFKDGGFLVFQTRKEVQEGECQFGIKVPD